MKKKKIVFFDGDGTIWYPKSTKRSIRPHWIYTNPSTARNYLENLVLDASAIRILRRLKSKGVATVLISTHPHHRAEARDRLLKKVQHFNLGGLFAEYHAAKDHPDGKKNVIERVLSVRNIPKSQALMIGDSYTYDYRAARRAGIDALLLETKYMNCSAAIRARIRTVKSLSQLLSYL